MSHRLLASALALLCFGALSCTDEDPVRPEDFAVTVQVRDAAGDPVPGLLMNLTSDNPYLQDFVQVKAATVIPFQTPVVARAALSIEDVEGSPVRLLGDRSIPAGVHHWVWDGRDQEGVLLHSGRYTARLILREIETEDVLFEATTDMLMCHLDPERSAVGRTDQAGTVVLTDRRLFPHLYERSPMTAQNENGEVMGLLVPTEQMIVTLADTAAGQVRTFRVEVAGSTNLELLWGKPRDLAVRAEAAQGDPVLPPVDFRLGPIFPNPFN